MEVEWICLDKIEVDVDLEVEIEDMKSAQLRVVKSKRAIESRRRRRS